MEVHCTLLITKYHAKSQKSKYQLEALQNEDHIIHNDLVLRVAEAEYER